MKARGSILEYIDKERQHLIELHHEAPNLLVLSPYGLAMFQEELGHTPLEDLGDNYKFNGMFVSLCTNIDFPDFMVGIS